MIRAAVFDFDGTLVDSNRIKRDAYDAVVARHPDGPELVREAIAAAPPSRVAVLERYAALQSERNGLRLDAARLVADYADRVFALVAAAPEMPGAGSLLLALRRARIACHLSSATPQDALAGLVRARGWAALFDTVSGWPSAKPETLRRLVSGAGLAAAEIAVVGDGEDDLASAREVGCRYFPVFEARGAPAGARRYALDELPAAFKRADGDAT
jgi:phosphoglycolate phosphatase